MLSVLAWSRAVQQRLPAKQHCRETFFIQGAVLSPGEGRERRKGEADLTSLILLYEDKSRYTVIHVLQTNKSIAWYL